MSISNLLTDFKLFCKIINYNLLSLISFEIVFKLASFLIFTPLFLHLFDFTMYLTGFSYLTLENVLFFIFNPITLALLLCLVFLMLSLTMFDITTVIIILDASAAQHKISTLSAIKLSLKKCLSIFHLQNLPLAFFVLFLIPFLNFGITSSFITSIKIPEFILDFIMHNPFLLSCSVILVIFLIILLLKWLYSLHFFILENLPFREARKRSTELSHNHLFQNLLTLLLLQFSAFIVYSGFLALGIFCIIRLEKIFNDILILKSITTTTIWIFVVISTLFIILMAVPISYSGISVMYYSLRKQDRQTIKHFPIITASPHPKLYSLLKSSIFICFILAFIGGSILNYGIYKGNFNFNIVYFRTAEITAHRGSSLEYPENTMLAFIAAKDAGADWIELDVQQTADQEIIVLHDYNLKRVTGLNKPTWEVTYNEIKNLDAGSFLDPNFSNARIPLLKEIVKWAKNNNIKLNIELKPTGHETNFEQQVVDIILAEDYEKYTVITSQVYHTLQNVKTYRPTIKTVYVMSIAYGNILALKYADGFSIETINITSKMVNKIHEAGKDIYAWTVNSTENIEHMINLGVDNIITDNVTLAKELVYSSKTTSLINQYANFVDNLH